MVEGEREGGSRRRVQAIEEDRMEKDRQKVIREEGQGGDGGKEGQGNSERELERKEEERRR